MTFAGRRRHGKTTFLINLSVALASQDEFLGYKIPEPRRTLMFLLEDDPRELQDKLARVVGKRATEGRIRIVTREDFLRARIPINIEKSNFKKSIRTISDEHDPDLIVVDNLAHVIGAKYSDPELIHQLMIEVYSLASSNDAAAILAAHPRKNDLDHPVRLDNNPELFFESVMGSSHLINSTGSLWGLERRDDLGYAIFLGGRQRGDGQQGFTAIEKGDDDWFSVLPGMTHSFKLVNHTQVRKDAWELLPNPPQTFGYREGEQLVKRAMKSGSTYNAWMQDLRRHRLVVEVEVKGKLQKASLLDLVPGK